MASSSRKKLIKPPYVLLESHSPDKNECSWLFTKPAGIVVASRAEQVLPALQRLEKGVEQGLHAAGYLGYEAAPGLDPGLRVSSQKAARMPLLWFGLFRERQSLQQGEVKHGAMPDLPPFTSRTSQNRYLRNVQAIQEEIAAGNTYQVNYTMQLRSRFNGEPLALYRSVCANQRAAYCACIEHDDIAVISASPELFFRWQDGRIRVRPMKGTAARGLDNQSDLAQARALRRSVKERAENLMIVDLLRNDLGRIAETGTVRVNQLFEVQRYPSLWQMTSSVTAQLADDVRFTDILQALFPCGSITGAPKQSTMKIICNLERAPRGVYTGAIGYISPGSQAVFSVAIRTLVQDKRTGELSMGVGSGITTGSSPEAEFQETMLKASFVHRRREPFQLLETLRYEPERGWLLLKEHMRRLKRSAGYFQFRCDVQTVRQALSDAVADFGGQAARVRLLVSSSGDVQIEVLALQPASDKMTLSCALAQEAIASDNTFLYHKTTRRQHYDHFLGASAGNDDVLLFNEHNELTEFCNGNLVVKLDGAFLTPPVSAGLLPGTFRSRLLESNKIIEKKLPVSCLSHSETIYRINAVHGWQRVDMAPNPISEIDPHSMQPLPPDSTG